MARRNGARPKFGGPINFRNRSKDAPAQRVCFHCDEPPTRRRPLLYHPEQPDAPCHRSCALVHFRMTPTEAEAILLPFAL